MKIYEASELLKTKKISSTELTEEILKKIDLNDNKLGAYITVCKDAALKQAAEADAKEIKNNLSGVPIAIKDNICTKSILTTAGSKILENFVPNYDATVVKKLKEQNAVMIGKTNMDEFAMGSGCENSGIKTTCNPIDYNFVPGGSSGGSAAAVRMGLALGALGSDTGGSVRQPAAFCGLYGLKPTYSLVSRYGLIAFASSFDTIGPICKSAKDAAIMLDAIRGKDENDMTSRDCNVESYVKNLSCDIKKIKIGIPKELFYGVDSSIKEIIDHAIKKYEENGAVVSECSIPSLKYAISAYYIVSSAEACANLARYDGVKFGKRAEKYKNLEDMYVKTRSMYFGDEVKRRIMLGTFVLSKEYYDLYYRKAIAAIQVIKKEMKEIFEKYDVLLSPVSPVNVWKRGETKSITEIYNRDICTSVANLAGIPAISIPCGTDENGLPVGFQLMGKWFDEQRILNGAYAYERWGE